MKIIVAVHEEVKTPEELYTSLLIGPVDMGIILTGGVMYTVEYV